MIGRLVVNGFNIDITDANDVAIAIPLMYCISDIKNPQDRKRNSSLPIAIPGTANNMAFFSSTYQLSLSNLIGDDIGFKFDPTQRVSAQYYKHGKKIFDGLIQLLNVTINNKNYTFNCCLFSNFIEVFQSCGQLKIAELGWNEYDHELNNTNIQDSWDTSVILNGVATPNFTGGVPDGFGYLYVLADYGYETNLRDHRNNNLAPHIYRKEFIEKCFALSNQTIGGDFIDSESFKRTLLGFGGGNKTTVSTTEVNNRRLTYNGTKDYTINVGPYSNSYIPGVTPYYKQNFNFSQNLLFSDTASGTVTVVTDNQTQLDEDTGKITSSATDNKSVRIQGELDVEITLNGSPDGFSGIFGLAAYVYKNEHLVNIFFATTYNAVGTGPTFNFTSTFDNTLSLSSVSGDVIEIFFKISGSGFFNNAVLPATSPSFDFNIVNDGDILFDIQSLQGPVVDGDTVYLANFLPDILCSEVLKGILTEANLYVSEPDRDGVVTIETLDEFYYDTTVHDDMTDKVDHSKTRTISPASNIDGKVYKFKFAEDNDYYNKTYRENYGIGYGDYDYQVQSTYQKGDKIFSLPWAQTVPVEVPGTNIVLPTIITVDTATGIVAPYKGKARVYYYQGLKTCDSWILRNSATPATFDTLTQWPACSHLDDYVTPTFDFNWNHPRKIYWTYTGNYPLNNFFSEYYEKFIREITGRDAKVLTESFKLSPEDVQPDKMRRLVMINGVLFRRNLIGPFNGNGEQTTIMELVRVIEGDSRGILSTTVIDNNIDRATIEGADDFIGGDPGLGIFRGESDGYSPTSRIMYG